MAEVFHGDGGGNQLNARADKSQVYGLKGNDTLTSDGKSDVLLIGGSGDDSLIMSGGNGTLAGGGGSDIFELNYSASKPLSAVIEDLEPARDKIVVNFDGDTAPRLSTVTSGNDVVLSDGTRLNVTLKGVRENDYFDGDTSDEAWNVLALTNAEREANGLSQLTASDGLTAGASIRAQEITDVYSHTRPNGTSCFTVLEKSYSATAENIAAGQNSSASVVSAWMNSPGHRANILNPVYQKLGVGYVYEDSLSYEHYWVQLFGSTIYSPAPETVPASDLLAANIEVNTSNSDSKFVTLTEGNDTYSNTVFGATIDARGGDDSITNSGFNVSISGGSGSDIFTNSGSFTTINAGTGNDLINLNAAQDVLIQYAAGDGNDTVSGLNARDTVSISGAEFTPVTVGNDVVVVVGVDSDSITLTGAARSNVQIVGGTRSKLYMGTAGNDIISVNVDGATIQPLGGNDSITNSGNNALFIHSGGNETINGFNDTSTLQVAGGSYTSLASGTDLILSNGTDSINILGSGDSSINIVDDNGNHVTVENARHIFGTEGNDSLNITLESATVQALGGDDTVDNNAAQVSISGGAGNDSVNNHQQRRTVYIYESGDDTIEGFNETDMLNIGGYMYSTVANGSDLIVNIIDNAATVGTVTIKDYSYDQGINVISTASNPGNDIYNYESNLSVIGTPNDDTIGNNGSNVTINALAGNDYVLNFGSNITINGGADNDDISSYGSRNNEINGGAGNDNIMNGWVPTDNRFSDFSTIAGGDGDDYVYNCGGKNVSILGGNGDDTLINNIAENFNEETQQYESVSSPDNSTINGGDGNDYLQNQGANVSINGGSGSDYISSYEGNNVTIDGDAGNDYIYNYGNNVTILGGTGNDQINLVSDSQNNFIRYADGDGNDTVWGITENDTLNLLAEDASLISSIVSGDDLIFNVGSGSVLLIGARNRPPHVVINESGTSGGGSGSGGSGGSGSGGNSGSGSGGSGGSGSGGNSGSGSGGSDGSGSGGNSGSGSGGNSGSGSGGNGGSGSGGNSGSGSGGNSGSGSGGNGGSGSGGNSGSGSGGNGGSGSGGGIGDGSGIGGNTSGGTSSNEGRGSAASGGGRSATGSAGRSASTGSSGGGHFRFIRNEHSTTANATTATTNTLPEAVAQLNHQTTANATQTTSTTSTQRIYTGGNQVIGDYTSGERIVFGATYTGAFYDGNGNFFAGSTTGALVVQNATDKVVDLTDAAGNDFVKAYAATTAGVIDGRGLAGFEVINGSAGADAIYAGDGGSQLWGGADTVSDAMMGGGGTDIFIGGRTQGADFFLNASSADIVHLNDSALSDIVATAEENGTIGIAFNTGNVVAIQSSEALSATVMLADGSAYRFNHANKSWQSA